MTFFSESEIQVGVGEITMRYSTEQAGSCTPPKPSPGLNSHAPLHHVELLTAVLGTPPAHHAQLGVPQC